MIAIYGPANLYNESLEYVLAKELHAHRVMFTAELDEIRSACAATPSGEPFLFLLDGSDTEHKDAIAGADGIDLDLECEPILAFYNLPRGIKLRRDMIRKGVRGLFYNEDTVAILVKGIRTLLHGDVWISQGTLLDLVLDESAASISETVTAAGLTEREVQILAHVSMGETNDEISESLGLSSHTVKTHLYNIYRKISVTNRFQASLWAAKHLR